VGHACSECLGCGGGESFLFSTDYAKVLLIIDQNSSVDCLTQQPVTGDGKGLPTDVCKMDYMAKSSDVAVGDMVITSGLGGIFPKGLPVGRISRVKDVSGELFKEIEVSPSVDFSKLEEVLVIQTGNSNGEESD